MMILRMLMWRRRTDPQTTPQVLCEPVQSTCMSMHMSQKSSEEPLYRNLQEKCRGPDWAHCRTRTHTLREPAKSKCMSMSESQETSEEPLYTNFSQKILRPKMGQERGHALCASLRSRNACQDFTRATLCGNIIW